MNVFIWDYKNATRQIMKNFDPATEEEKQKAQFHKSLLRLKGKTNLQIDLSIPRDRQDQVKK